MKRLVILCDGTWNRADQKRDGRPCPTNVVKLHQAVAGRAVERIDDQTRPAEEDVRGALDKREVVIQVTGRGQELVLADIDGLPWLEGHGNELARVVFGKSDMPGAHRLSHH